ncbi:MAG: aminotransferase class I/II-fold pyridoxal phosphate-dependent enzyme [Synergistaceae bacterium]|jgi:aspartate/methionine/tyrosine aminotransferase|nr:aminotransferase class I/II-fold pyridoxal phosphate-dependent enzyme [Synergistaceae bacterium]
MRIAPFGVEQWMNEWETGAVTNLAETCVDSMTLGELLDIDGSRDSLGSAANLRLSYGDIKGSDELLALIASLYENQSSENVIVMNGGIAANFISMFTLVEPGDEVICMYPTYQQLYSIPESFGADVNLLRLRHEDGFLPDLDRLESMVTKRTKLICVNNPNNPTGSLLREPELRRIADIAGSVGAWVHCDEAYRFMVHAPDEQVPSMVSLYDRAVVSCSLSKCFSLAGLRIGWLVGPRHFIDEVFSRRDYTTISCGMLDDLFARAAVRNSKKIFARNLAIVRSCAAMLDEWVDGEPKVDYARPSAGTTAFLRYGCEIGSEDFCRRLFKKDGTFLLPGRCFGNEFDRYLRIGYAYSPDVLNVGLRKLSDFLRDLEREGL